LIIIFDIQYWTYGAPYNRWISAFFYPFTKVIWAINTAAVIWMCITGNGGFVNKFLSLEAFIPLSRLTYSVYLTHAWIVWIYWGSKRDLVDLNNFTIVSLYFGVLLMSYLIGALFSILFESPFFLLQKYLKDYFQITKNYIIPQEMNELKTQFK
jgi:peptidoglycan/LPS O-acetylase OafA/YrhL